MSMVRLVYTYISAVAYSLKACKSNTAFIYFRFNCFNLDNVVKLCCKYALTNQGSNLPFENNRQMASTWSTFTSHKCVSTSLGMGTAQNCRFYLINNSTCSCLKNNSLFH